MIVGTIATATNSLSTALRRWITVAPLPPGAAAERGWTRDRPNLPALSECRLGSGAKVWPRCPAHWPGEAMKRATPRLVGNDLSIAVGDSYSASEAVVSDHPRGLKSPR